MKKILCKLIIFILPFLVGISIELFILPIDYFTFRVWEAIIVKKFNNILPGPFYPNVRIQKIEEGDLAHHTKFAIKKTVVWYTDRYGYRKIDLDNEYYPIVIVGDSNIAGSGLNQEDILSEVLERKLNMKVYPFAPEGIGKLIKNERFKEKSPKIVVFGAVEREIPYLSPLKTKIYKSGSYIKEKIRSLRENRFLENISIYLDRFYKANMLNFLRASLRRIFNITKDSNPQYIDPDFGPIFFLQGPAANQDVKDEILKKALNTIKTYNEALKTRGIRFIFLPIPEKENIFYKLLNTKRPVFLEKLIAELKREGIEVIDTQKALNRAFRSIKYYFTRPMIPIGMRMVLN